jgi:cobalt/nickel transport system permease protein
MILRKKESHIKVNRFIEHTIRGVISLLKETIINEKIASKNGFLQRCDPRFKCLNASILLVSIQLTKSVILLCILYLVCLSLAFASAINLGFYLKRTLLFIPLFSLFIAVPALFNAVTPGKHVFSLKILTYDLSITKQGIDSALIFFMRVLSSVSFSILLVLTTRHNVLLKVFRIFKVPLLFVATINMSYRYIYLLLDIVANTFIAIKSRVGYISSTKTGRRVVGANIAGLWMKSYRLQTQIYDAMLSRGYTGEPKILDESHSSQIDYVALIITILILIGTVCLNRFLT